VLRRVARCSADPYVRGIELTEAELPKTVEESDGRRNPRRAMHRLMVANELTQRGVQRRELTQLQQ
jgi:hypothetical protein